MAEQLTWEGLLSDPTRYPDSMLWTLEDGSQVALGTLRQTVRGNFVSASELQQTRRQSEAQIQQARAAQQQAEAQLIAVLSQTQPPGTGTAETVPDFWQTDPGFRPVLERVNSLGQENAQLKHQLTQMQQLQQQMFGTIQQIPVVMSVQKIQATDPEVDGQQLLQFAADNQIQPHRLDLAHKALTRDRDVARAREQAYAQAKAELAARPPEVPYAPFGMPQVQPPGVPAFENEQQLEQAMLQDPEIMQVFMGQA